MRSWNRSTAACHVWFSCYSLFLVVASRNSTLEADRCDYFEIDIDIFKKIHRYLASCRYFIDNRYRYFKICLPIYLPIFQSILIKVSGKYLHNPLSAFCCYVNQYKCVSRLCCYKNYKALLY